MPRKPFLKERQTCCTKHIMCVSSLVLPAGQDTAFLLQKDCLQEINWFKQEFGSWFAGNRVIHGMEEAWTTNLDTEATWPEMHEPPLSQTVVFSCARPSILSSWPFL